MPNNPLRPRKTDEGSRASETQADANQRFSPVALVSMGMGIYFVTLWFGVTVVGDNAGRSAVMAGVILAIAIAGYLTNGRRKPPERPDG